MNETAKHQNPWTELELEYVADHYGLIPTKQIAHQLNRSERAVYTAATQKLNQRITDNFYSATELARLLGLPKIGRIVRWVEKGWLKGKKSPICSGQFKFWCFDEEDIVECLRQRPWLVDFRQMLRHYFRSIVKDEWERDRWYTVKQAEPLIGCPHAVYRYIQMGWLRADEGPAPGKNKWIIRDSAIKAFLENKPHLQHRRSASSSSMRKYKMSMGLPSRIAITWLFRCPDCGNIVKVVAPPILNGPQVRDLFLEEYTNGRCSHGAECLINSATPLRGQTMTYLYCPFCRETVPNPKMVPLRQKLGGGRYRLIHLYLCPKCNGTLRSYTDYLVDQSPF